MFNRTLSLYTLFTSSLEPTLKIDRSESTTSSLANQLCSRWPAQAAPTTSTSSSSSDPFPFHLTRRTKNINLPPLLDRRRAHDLLLRRVVHEMGIPPSSQSEATSSSSLIRTGSTDFGQDFVNAVKCDWGVPGFNNLLTY